MRTKGRQCLSVRPAPMDVLVCLLLACLLCRAACASSRSEVDGAEGRSITFHLQNLKGENLAWSFRGEAIFSIKLGNSTEPSFYEDSYKSRVTFLEDGRALTISQLGKDDAGTYVAKNSVFKASFTLRVYSLLQEPAVTCVSWNCSADGCRYMLRCTVQTPGNKSFFWSHGERLDAEGPEVMVGPLPPGEQDVPWYTCTVQNPVSSRNATVSPAAVCAENTSWSHTADTYSSHFTGTIAAMVIVMLIILGVVLAYLLFRGRKDREPHTPGAPATEVTAEYMTVYAEVGTSQQQMQDFPRAQKNDPKKMPAPGAETSKTIYSTIQAMAQVDDNKMDSSTPGC